MKSLKAAERQASDELTEAMRAAKLSVAESRQYVATLAASKELTPDAAQLRELPGIGPKTFLSLVRVDVKAARGVVAERDLERISEIKQRVSLRVSKRPDK